MDLLKTEFLGYTIEQVETRNPYARGYEFMIYPTAQGAEHDADYDGDGFVYCGNCKWFDTLEDAKDEILYLVDNADGIEEIKITD